MDRASVYDTHNRVFYIFYVGRFHNRPIYHFGETNDIDATEFFVKSNLPFYELVLYLPVDTEQDGLSQFSKYIHQDRVELPVHNMEHLDVFSPSRNDLETIVKKVEDLYRANADKEYI